MIPTQNIKLEQFLNVVFGSQLSLDEMRFETIHYVKILETVYNEKIKSLQVSHEKLRKLA